MRGTEATPDTSRPQRTILLVEDEPDTRESMRLLIESEGYACSAAESGTQAMRILDATVPDLIVMDYMMPGMTGLELCETIRARPNTRSVPIIMFSAYPLNPQSSRGLYDRAILKPIEFDELLFAIRSLLRRDVNPS